MIEKISTTFDFGKLLKNLDKVFEKNMDARKEIFVKGAREIIKGGKLRKNKKSTLLLKGEGLIRGNRRIHSPKRPKSLSTGSTKPLIHSGNLLASIKSNEEGIQFAEYGAFHLNDYQIKSNWFTDTFLKSAIGNTVKKRNFLPITEKGNLSGKMKKRFKKVEEDFYKAINRFLTK